MFFLAAPIRREHDSWTWRYVKATVYFTLSSCSGALVLPRVGTVNLRHRRSDLHAFYVWTRTTLRLMSSHNPLPPDSVLWFLTQHFLYSFSTGTKPSLWLQFRGNNHWRKKKLGTLPPHTPPPHPSLSPPLLYKFAGLRGCRSCMKMKLLHPFGGDGGFCIKHFYVWT